MKNLIKISKKLNDFGVYHNINKNIIITRRSKTRVPKFNKDITYLLGVITGDGDVLMHRRKKGGFHYSIRITSGSIEYLDYLNYLFKKYFMINGSIYRDKRVNHTYSLNFRNAVIFWYFVISGHPIGKKIALSIPKIVDRKSLLLNYLAGLVDTDGYVDCNGHRIQLKQKSHNLIKQVYNKLSDLGIQCNEPKINYTNSKPFYYIRFDNKLPLRLRSSVF